MDAIEFGAILSPRKVGVVAGLHVDPEHVRQAQRAREPQATFSACFGAPFMPRHPSVYADLLRTKMKEHNTQAWLLNTGWSGGPYGVGARMSIKHTRRLLNAILDGTLSRGDFTVDERFGVEVPLACPGVPDNVLQPRQTWTDKDAYDSTANKLAALFVDNFRQFEAGCDPAVVASGPRL